MDKEKEDLAALKDNYESQVTDIKKERNMKAGGIFTSCVAGLGAVYLASRRVFDSKDNPEEKVSFIGKVKEVFSNSKVLAGAIASLGVIVLSTVPGYFAGKAIADKTLNRRYDNDGPGL